MLATSPRGAMTRGQHHTDTSRKGNYLTCLETQPLSRMQHGDLEELLDTVMSSADWELSLALSKQSNISYYTLYSISLLYHEAEASMLNNAGFIALYHTSEGYPPTVHQYEYNSYVCWTGKDDVMADAVRSSLGLRRYRLFIRYTSSTRGTFSYHWQFNHAGQLLLPTTYADKYRRPTHGIAKEPTHAC